MVTTYIHTDIVYPFDRRPSGTRIDSKDEIPLTTVKDIVTRAIGFLLHFSARKRLFTFVNHSEDGYPNTQTTTIVLQQENQVGLISLVIEAHSITGGPHNYLIKVLAAKRTGPFPLRKEQYCLQLHEEGGATLSRFENNKLLVIATA